uniref:Annexin n=1 Tax=Gadus morhua TaxID=8049 RepID=A0A8C5B8S2_GADMO
MNTNVLLQVFRGSITEAADFDATADSEALYNAMKGFGEAPLDSFLASRNNQQIHDMVEACAVCGINANDLQLNDATFSPPAYGSDMEEDVVRETSGHFKKMLVVLLQGTRDESGVVDADLVEQDAQVNCAKALRIVSLCTASVCFIVLPTVFDQYEKIAEKSIEDSIKSELSGDFERVMLAVVHCIRSVSMFFARRLYKSMKGLGTADNTLIRIMIARSEIDMLDIRECFRLRYEKSLYNMIKEDTSGDYKRTLLQLCGGDDDLAGEFFPEAAQIAYKMWEQSAMTKVKLRPTLLPAVDFDPAADAQALRKAMKGFGTDEDIIIDIIARRSNAQRQEIRQTFKSLLGRDLMKDLKSELSKNLERLVIGLMLTPAEFDAKMMRKAIEGVGTDEHALIEILVTRSNEGIQAMNAAYSSAYKKSLEGDIQSDTSGHFCRILTSLVQGGREEGEADLERADADAQELADACNAESDDMEMKFQTILCTRSFPHLRRVFQEFVRFTNKDIEQIIKKEMSGDVKNAFYAIVCSVKNQPSYFADRLYKAMKGLGTDDRALIRILVSRSEVDLFNIRKEFKETQDESLHDFIQGDTSGDYRKTLLLLCGGED